MKRKDEKIFAEAYVHTDGIHIIVDHCPFCGEMHVHSTGGSDWRNRILKVDKKTTLGPRVPHCLTPQTQQYYLWLDMRKNKI
jgi:hypothetical protein